MIFDTIHFIGQEQSNCYLALTATHCETKNSTLSEWKNSHPMPSGQIWKSKLGTMVSSIFLGILTFVFYFSTLGWIYY